MVRAEEEAEVVNMIGRRAATLTGNAGVCWVLGNRADDPESYLAVQTGRRGSGGLLN